MMVGEASLLGMADTHVHLVEGMGAVSVDMLVLLDMDMGGVIPQWVVRGVIPQWVVAGFPGKVPVDMREFDRKAVDVQRHLVCSELKRFLLDWFDPVFGCWTLPL